MLYYGLLLINIFIVSYFAFISTVIEKEITETKEKIKLQNNTSNAYMKLINSELRVKD